MNTGTFSVVAQAKATHDYFNDGRAAFNCQQTAATARTLSQAGVLFRSSGDSFRLLSADNSSLYRSSPPVVANIALEPLDPITHAVTKEPASRPGRVTQFRETEPGQLEPRSLLSVGRRFGFTPARDGRLEVVDGLGKQILDLEVSRGREVTLDLSREPAGGFDLTLNGQLTDQVYADSQVAARPPFALLTLALTSGLSHSRPIAKFSGRSTPWRYNFVGMSEQESQRCEVWQQPLPPRFRFVKGKPRTFPGGLSARTFLSVGEIPLLVRPTYRFVLSDHKAPKPRPLPFPSTPLSASSDQPHTLLSDIFVPY